MALVEVLMSSLLRLLQVSVLEAIRISCAGYPTRRSFDEFLLRFGVLAPEVLGGKEGYMPNDFRQNGIEGLSGKTKVFLRACQMAELDARRAKVLGNAAKTIQRQIYTLIARKEFISLRRVAIQLQSCWRAQNGSSSILHVLLFLWKIVVGLHDYVCTLTHATRETGALKEAKDKLEKKVEELTWRLQFEKRLRSKLEETKANARVIKEQEAAQKAIEEAPPVVKEICNGFLGLSVQDL
ncbi:unnamed protein product [Fraxinus pennsylvanica]|uniref:Myosin motor domain-containing protein n=1 Tax=Fraxinus pennsylvanica TaxID=56036 RepID=A0AAD1ZAL4_9LAMI|nr:unnamed protein product [Fraxinus pennsylvanica]